jgi:acetyltransferase-like isoleucine patch superfamily enzyme
MTKSTKDTKDDVTRINEEELMQYHGYKGGIGRLKFRLNYLRSWLLQSIAYSSPHPGLAIKMQRARGVKIGRNCYIGPHVQIDLIHPEMVKIEDNVTIGTNTMIFAHSVASANQFLKSIGYGRKIEPVIIKTGAVIYPGCIITAGITIGMNSMIAVGSVVADTIPDYCIAVGNPARVIKKIDDSLGTDRPELK